MSLIFSVFNTNVIGVIMIKFKQFSHIFPVLILNTTWLSGLPWNRSGFHLLIWRQDHQAEEGRKMSFQRIPIEQKIWPSFSDSVSGDYRVFILRLEMHWYSQTWNWEFWQQSDATYHKFGQSEVKKIDSPCAKSVESKDKAAIINVVVVVMGHSENGLGSWPLGTQEWKHERQGSFPLIGINCYHGH